MKIKNVLKGISLTVVSLLVGFFAIGFPFKIFTNLSADGVRIFFIVEILVYMLVAGIFLTILEKKKDKQEKESQRLIRRQAKVNDVIENWYNIAA